MVATDDDATASLIRRRRGLRLHGLQPCVALHLLQAAVRSIAAAWLLAAAVTGTGASAAGKVRITNLSDVGFGTIANLGQDAIQSQSLCLYSNSPTSGYNITGTGTGPGGNFELSSGSGSLAYDVEWSSSAGQSSGAQLTPNVPLTGQVSTAAQQTCNSGPATSASLIIILRSAALSSATAGSYIGTLTLLVGAE